MLGRKQQTPSSVWSLASGPSLRSASRYVECAMQRHDQIFESEWRRGALNCPMLYYYFNVLSPDSSPAQLLDVLYLKSTQAQVKIPERPRTLPFNPRFAFCFCASLFTLRIASDFHNLRILLGFPGKLHRLGQHGARDESRRSCPPGV